MRQTIWTPEDITRAKALMTKCTARETAEIMGVTKSALLGAMFRARHRDVRFTGTGTRHVTHPELRNVADEYFAGGHTLESLASKYGVNKSSIYRRITLSRLSAKP